MQVRDHCKTAEYKEQVAAASLEEDLELVHCCELQAKVGGAWDGSGLRGLPCLPYRGRGGSWRGDKLGRKRWFFKKVSSFSPSNFSERGS